MNKNYFFLILVLVITSIRCTNESIESREICFETEIRPIISSNCTLSGCHNSIDKESDRDYTTYEGIIKDVKPGNHAGSKLYKVLISTSNTMPPSDDFEPLTESQILTIASWIEQGAKLNMQCIPLPCDSSNITLSGSVKPILDLYCGSCHNSSISKNIQGNVDFKLYSELKLYVDDGSLSGSINHISPFSRMPKNSSKMPDCEIAIIDKWIRLGAPNN